MMRAKKKTLIEKKFFARNPFLQNNGITHFAAKIFFEVVQKIPKCIRGSVTTKKNHINSSRPMERNILDTSSQKYIKTVLRRRAYLSIYGGNKNVLHYIFLWVL